MKNCLSTFALLLFLATVASQSQSQIPHTISYQGVLQKEGSLFNGDAQFIFTMYRGSTAAWISPSVPAHVNNGVFSTILGPFPDTLSFKSIDSLGISFNGTQLSPRIAMTAVAFSLASEHATFADSAANPGPAGAKGEKGDKGDKGDRGEKGLDGVGSRGDKGDKGDRGLDGVGLKGDRGEKGPDGLGLKGDRGDKGDRGEKGLDGVGSRGDKGDKGDRGLDGVGSRGDKGDKGDKGFDGVGSRGDKGDKGDRGLDGLGSKGDKGDKGDRGEKGPDGLGLKGDKGDKGDRGLDGSPGQGGLKGDKGDRGEKGLDGVGLKGDKGDRGEKGLDGVGLKGDKGDRGEKGLDGAGLKGDRGDKGDKGDSGPGGKSDAVLSTNAAEGSLVFSLSSNTGAPVEYARLVRTGNPNTLRLEVSTSSSPGGSYSAWWHTGSGIAAGSGTFGYGSGQEFSLTGVSQFSIMVIVNDRLAKVELFRANRSDAKWYGFSTTN